MSKVLVVHRTEWNGVLSNYGELLGKHDVVIMRYPLGGDIGALPPLSELFCIGLRPKQAAEVQNHLRLSTEPRRLNDLRGAHATEFRSWITGAPTTIIEAKTTEDAPPWPGYKEYILSRAGESPRLIVSQNALNRANKVVGREDMYGEHLIGFVCDAMDALISIANNPASIDLQEVLAKRNGLDYAATGGEFTARYKNPATGRLTSTTRHLKPATERKGYYPPEQKPRLYFDMFFDPRTQEHWVVLLYLGPHPKENTKNEFVLPALQDGQLTRK